MYATFLLIQVERGQMGSAGENGTPLLLAARGGHLNVLNYLINNFDADVNAQNDRVDHLLIY